MEELLITDRVKNLADAYTELGLFREEELPFSSPKNGRQEAVNSVNDAFILGEALNEKWEPNWDDDDEEKHELWWDMRSVDEDPSAVGSGFSLLGVRYDVSYTSVGSRLVFRTRALAYHAAEICPEIFKGFMVISKTK